MKFLNAKKCSFGCILIALFVMITGMCFDQVKTDSLFSYMPSEDMQPVILSIGTSVWEQQICTPKMLQIRNVGVVSETRWSERQGREAISWNLILADLFLKESGGTFLLWVMAVFLSDEAGKRIANFVHKSDGKKRECFA